MIKKFIVIYFGLLVLTLNSVLVNGSTSPKSQMPTSNTWISISGTVDTILADRFLLDYGAGRLTVEIDDADIDASGYKLVHGDKVRVNGMVDDDALEAIAVEAGSVYIERLNAYLQAGSVQSGIVSDEDSTERIWDSNPVVVGEVILQGRVSEVLDKQISITTGLNSIAVAIGDLSPKAPQGRVDVQIDEGDVVRVSAQVEEELFENRALAAENVVVLSQ